jgi:hypothetical protein
LKIHKRLLKWWQDPELNRGHKDFQSSALPTELSCQPIANIDVYHFSSGFVFHCIPRSVLIMNSLLETTTAGAQSVPKTKRNDNTSTDGKWRSFPKVPNLLQYVVAGTYYAKCKVNGKRVRASLETDVFTTAKLRLPDKLKELRKPKTQVGTFADGRIKYETESSKRPESCAASF